MKRELFPGAVADAHGVASVDTCCPRQTGSRVRTQTNRPLNLSGGCGDPDFDIQTDRCRDVDMCVRAQFAELPAGRSFSWGRVRPASVLVPRLDACSNLQLFADRLKQRRATFRFAALCSVSASASQTPAYVSTFITPPSVVHAVALLVQHIFVGWPASFSRTHEAAAPLSS